MSSKPNKKKVCFSALFYLFFAFFKISLFTLGGGYVMISVMEQEFVKRKKLLDETIFNQLIAKTQMLPGPVAFSSSCFIGHELAGFPGLFISFIGTMIPPIITIILVFYFFSQIKDIELVKHFMWGVKLAVIAIIAHLFYSFIKKQITSIPDFVFTCIALILLFFVPVQPLIILLAATFTFIVLDKVIKKHTGNL